MSVDEAKNHVWRGWSRLRPLLERARDSSQEPWMRQYLPPSTALDEYFHGSLDRFALLLDVVLRHAPSGARVLDAGAGYAMQSAALREAGFDIHAADVYQHFAVYDALDIPYRRWHLEADEKPPFEAESFDAVILSQTIEHFTYSPLRPLTQLLQVLRPGGILLIDAPNIASFHNVWRLLRGRTIHWSLRRHYLEQQPQMVGGVPYYDRHNREYAMEDLIDIAEHFSLHVLERGYYSPVNRRSKPAWMIALSRLRDGVPHWRKGLYALYRKPARLDVAEEVDLDI